PSMPVPGGQCLRLHGADVAAGDRLLAALLRALGIAPEQVSARADAALPLLVFGDGGDPGADGVRAPALPQLRDAAAKRALWPALRRLRRRLHGPRRDG